jgi:hypothetical protein
MKPVEKEYQRDLVLRATRKSYYTTLSILKRNSVFGSKARPRKRSPQPHQLLTASGAPPEVLGAPSISLGSITDGGRAPRRAGRWLVWRVKTWLVWRSLGAAPYQRFGAPVSLLGAKLQVFGAGFRAM